MGRPPFDPRRSREPEIRINHRIRADQVRVIGPTGVMLGVMSTREALGIARDHLLDLVEVNPKAEPPVCKVMDFGKYKYEEKKKAREAKRKQTVVDIKEIKLRPKTDDHDMNFKLRAARRFVETGNKVKFIVRFRGREIAHPERAERQLNLLLQQLEDLVNIDSRPTMEGRTMTVMVTPKPAVMQKVTAAKAAAEAARKKAEAEGRMPPPETRSAADDEAERLAKAGDEEFDDDEDEAGSDEPPEQAGGGAQPRA
jgi:translation initiation factor IF-3